KALAAKRATPNSIVERNISSISSPRLKSKSWFPKPVPVSPPMRSAKPRKRDALATAKSFSHLWKTRSASGLVKPERTRFDPPSTCREIVQFHFPFLTHNHKPNAERV